MSLELRSIDKTNFYEICQLQVAQNQVNHVDSNAISLAEANFMSFPWFKGIYSDNNPIGFVLVNANTVSGKFELWRFMLDKSQQSKGYGRIAIDLLKSALVNEFGISALYTSVVTGSGSPQGFYESCGFVSTGHLVEGREIELCLSL
ncbi:TPA: GNAT family N-acetyltransferase [Vibrio vulnificus]|uniref:Acetyltransferase n=2 Tax=Vibrio TaxID=662 RepID=A0A151JG24_9VIBR|nr:GNAT family N-acetyltransferase [Vibrio vulnificus]KYN24721.1 acetyltransferase [Vibrio cidicii]ARN66072.1 acetyltransferase, GNAT family [Vibrio vulnificus]EGR1869936.1 GNAT family N-acetyltransferase [Vibrio vulnificus]EID4426008.1 GNAT family N-acetyltransferase [Vibrio vulnificus]EJE8694962.1 GNAT family N-acetyltransferase [Vibrio vulnificus]